MRAIIKRLLETHAITIQGAGGLQIRLIDEAPVWGTTSSISLIREHFATEHRRFAATVEDAGENADSWLHAY